MFDLFLALWFCLSMHPVSLTCFIESNATLLPTHPFFFKINVCSKGMILYPNIADIKIENTGCWSNKCVAWLWQTKIGAYRILTIVSNKNISHFSPWFAVNFVLQLLIHLFIGIILHFDSIFNVFASIKNNQLIFQPVMVCYNTVIVAISWMGLLATSFWLIVASFSIAYFALL